MIIDIMIKIWVGLLNLIVWLLPSWHLPDFIHASFMYFMYWIAGITLVIPALSAVWTVLFLMIFFKLTVFIFNLMSGFAALIRGSGKPSI